MIIREINQNDKQMFNQAASHPLQSYEWGEFRKKTNVEIIRKGVFENDKLIHPVQVTIHPLPKVNLTVGYFPKGKMPDENQIKVLKEIGKEYNCIMIKMEPNVGAKVKENMPKTTAFESIDEFLQDHGCVKGRRIFTKYTFELDLTKNEEELMALMKSKTRYNVGLAKRKGVKVVVDNSENNFKWFLKLLFENTISRQGFYAHNADYFKKMWSILKPAGMAYLLRAEYKNEVLAVFMVFVFNKTIYYPYGASIRKHKKLMAPNLLMWELIRFGKKLNCEKLDMWGALGPKPNKKDGWYGFHRFKQGYGGDLVEFIGSYDLVINPKVYPVYKLADKIRWMILNSKASLKKLPFKITHFSKQIYRSMVSLFE